MHDSTCPITVLDRNEGSDVNKARSAKARFPLPELTARQLG